MLFNDKRSPTPTLLLVSLALTLVFSSTRAQAIDLKCQQLTQTLIEQLVANDLLDTNVDKQVRAQRLALDLCIATAESAQQQHELDKQEALENWFFEYHPEKPGNRRLKKTH